ncbi:MAG TPA: ABC transporter substrate-binding protein [Dehalococcoidia bacterium]
MNSGKALRFLFLAAVLAPALLVAACGDDEEGEEGAAGGGGTVDVLGIWGAEELESFEAMVSPWQDRTGSQMNFTGTRDITALLTTRVEGGSPPDVAIPAEIGLFQRFAQEGRLVPLSACDGLEETVRDNYPQSFIDLGTVNGTLYGFFMKADTKATIWYNPSFFDEHGYEPLDEDSSFQDLLDLSNQILEDRRAGDHDAAPWSMGMDTGAGGGSGFPGSDWIQQILLNEQGTEVYDGVLEGSIPFTDPRVRDAWEKFGQVALTDGYVVQGGGNAINATNFMEATYPPFQSPPTAAMTYLGGFASTFIQAQFPDAEPGEDFDFFPFPGGRVTGGANIVYAFNSDETTCSFLNWLASAEAQEIWVERGGFTSVNRQVGLDAYPNEVARKQAEQLLEAETFRFDLDDALGGALQNAIFTGVLNYLRSPGDLDRILQGIEASRR